MTPSRLLLVTFGVLTLAPGLLRAQEPSPVDTLRLGVLLDQSAPAIDQALDELVTEIRAVVGVRAVVDFDPTASQIVGFDADRTRQAYDALVGGGADVVLAFGTGVGAVLPERDAFPVPTILFGTFISDASQLPSVGETSGVPNFTFLVTVRSWQSDLEALGQLVDVRRLGVVIPAGLGAVLPPPETLGPILDGLGATAVVLTYEGIDRLRADLGSVDAVYLPETIIYEDDEIREIASLLIERGIPSFSGSRREDVELGIMATTRSLQDRERLVRRIALHVEAVVEGVDLASRPILVDLEEQLAVNLYTAQAVDLPIRVSLLGEAEFVGEYQNPRALETYTLEGLVEEALAANLGVESTRRDVRLSELDRATGWSAFLPDVGLGVTQSVLDESLAAAGQGQNPQYTTQTALSIGQVLYSPAAAAGISILDSQLESQREVVRAAEWDLIQETSDAYFTTLILKANAEIQARNLDATNRNLRVAEENYEAGQIGLADVLRLRSQAASEKQALVTAVTRVQQSFHRINQLVDQPIDREIDVSDLEFADGSFMDEDFERVRAILDDPRTQNVFQDWAVAEALQQSPELASLNYNIDALDRRARLFGWERFIPTVSGGVDLIRVQDRSGAGAPPAGLLPDQYWTLGIAASVPLFESNRNRLDRQISDTQARQLELQRDQVGSQIEQATRDVVLAMVQTMADIELSTISEETALQSLELAQQAYATGAISIVDLLDIQANALSAQVARVSATYNFLNTSVVLQRLTGNFLILGGDDERRALLDRFEAFRDALMRQDMP